MTLKKTLLASKIGATVAASHVADDRKRRNLRIGYSADPETLDLHEQLSGGVLRFSHLAFDPLVRWTKTFSLSRA